MNAPFGLGKALTSAESPGGAPDGFKLMAMTPISKEVPQPIPPRAAPARFLLHAGRSATTAGAVKPQTSEAR